MANIPYPRLVMLGAAPGTHGSIASVVDAYRAHGLFRRWAIDYLATHGQGGALRNASLGLGALRKFTALIARERRMAVHLHAAADRFWGDAPFMLLAIATRCPLILHLHGAGFEQLHERASAAGRRAMRLVFEHAACVVAPCEALRNWTHTVARGAQVLYVPNPVGPAQAIPETPRPNVVLFLGRLEPVKGLFDLLEAVSAVRGAVPDVRLVCAGEGDRLAVTRHAERLGIADAVKFTGWVGPSGKRALLETAAVFALPSYDEALPMSLLEAMGAGVPAIASPVGGMPEVVANGVSGFLVAPGDVATLTRLLRKLLLDRKLGEHIGAAGRETVRLRFAPERALPKLEKIYADIGLHSLGETPRALEAGLGKAA